MRAAAVEPAATTLHYAANGSYASAPEGVGFNIWDVGPYAEEVAELPAGKRALIWIGDGWDQCAPETVPDADFYPLVDALASNPKVWGWFIWDEPNVNGCPGLVDIITERATYIKQKSGGRQRTFIVGDGGWGAAVDGRLAPTHTRFRCGRPSRGGTASCRALSSTTPTGGRSSRNGWRPRCPPIRRWKPSSANASPAAPCRSGV